MDEEGEAHASRIRCRFKRARRDCMGRSFWEHWRTETCAFLVAMCSTVLILFLEPALWSDTWPAGIFDFRIPNSLAASLLLVLPFNGWLLDRFLSSKTANETACPQWLLMLRGLFASVPLAGLYAISLWKLALAWTASRRVTRSLRLDLSRRCDRLAVGLHPRALYRSGFFFVWLASNFLPLLVWALWLGQTGALGSARRPVIAGVCILLHLVAAFSIGLHVWTELQSPEIRGWRRALLALAPASWLLAIPGMVLGFSAFLLADPPRKSLTWLTYASRTAAMRDRGWRELQGSLRRSWERKSWFKQWRRPAGLLPSQGRGHADLQVIALQRLKTLLLTLESGALLAVLPAGFTPVALPRTLWVAASLAALGLGIQTVGLAARLLRAPWSLALHRHPYGRYLLLSQSAFLSGLGAAWLWQAGRIEELGWLLCLGGAGCGMAAVLFLSIPLAGPDMTLWGALFLSLSAAGGLIALDGRGYQPSLAALRLLAALTPLWSLGLGCALSGWLLRPYSWRHVLDRALPLRLRLTLGLVGLTSAIPLGGLAIPFWIYARHRVLPRYRGSLGP